MSMIKNISKAEVLVLKDQVAYQEGQVVSKTLAQNDALSVTLFSFDKGEEISTHESGGDAFVTCLDGVGEITINGEKYELHEGESIIIPRRTPHLPRQTPFPGKSERKTRPWRIIFRWKKSQTESSIPQTDGT